MAVIDVAGYVADLKDHSVDHGFHVHDERHFVETYSLRQVWEVDLHPEEGCGGPLDLHLALEVDPRTLLSFEDAVIDLPEDVEPPDEFHFPLTFTWGLPPLPHGPDLLRLAIDLAGVGGIDLPLEVSAIDSFASATDAPDRRLSILARYPVSLARILGGRGAVCARCSTAAWRSAGSCSTRPRAGSTDDDPGVRSRRRPADPTRRPSGGVSAPGPPSASPWPSAPVWPAAPTAPPSASSARPATTSTLSICALPDGGDRDQIPSVAAHDRSEAQTQLQNASPLATVAAGQAPQWQALMATLAESSRLPESDLVRALQAQCAATADGRGRGPDRPRHHPAAPTLPSSTGPSRSAPPPGRRCPGLTAQTARLAQTAAWLRGPPGSDLG